MAGESVIRVFGILFIVSCFYFFAACQAVQPTAAPVVPGVPAVDKPAVVHAAPVLPWGHPDWSGELIKNMTDKLPVFAKARDIVEYCPKFDLLNDESKIVALAFIAVGVSKFESGWKIDDHMTEKTGAVSTGLFQLSYGDSHCPRTRKEADLNSFAVNIKCAVAIMADEVAKDGAIASGGYTQYGALPARGMARYWSVLRTPDSKSRHHKLEIQAISKTAPGCL